MELTHLVDNYSQEEALKIIKRADVAAFRREEAACGNI